jgi:threonine/homoserine/homoserine lactone efflux protein
MLPDSITGVMIFSFVVGFGAVISPGPVSTAIVTQAPRHGWLTGPLVSVGHSLMELVLVTLIIFGLGSILAQASIQIAIALLGGLLLAWMGFGMLWTTLRGRTHLPARTEQAGSISARQLFTLGIIATISNPFWYAWWVTVAAGYLAQAQEASLAIVTAFYMGHISADFAWNTALWTVIGGGRRWINDRVYQVLMLAGGAFLVYLAWVFIFQGARLLSGSFTG